MSETPTATPAMPKYCDVIMKGGTASAIVYPPFLAKLAEVFELRNLGGASAGAIGAVLGAAAEYRRQKGKTQQKPKGDSRGYALLEGFDELIKTGGGIKAQFEPAPETRGLWDAMWAWTGSRGIGRCVGVVKALVGNYGAGAALGAAVGVVLASSLAGLLSWPTGGVLLVLLVLLAAATAAVGQRCRVAGQAVALVVVLIASGAGLAAARSTLALLALVVPGALVGLLIGSVVEAVGGFWRTAERLGFGICPGDRLTLFLHGIVQLVAGRAKPGCSCLGRPLTFGDLAECVFDDGGAIQLALVTTSVGHRRPYFLPLRAHTWRFDPQQLTPLIGAPLVEWLTKLAEEELTALAKADLAKAIEKNTKPKRREPLVAQWDGRVLYRLPENMPLVVGMRISMALPFVLSAVPLWESYYRPGHRGEERQKPSYRQVWFTDGGVTSNLPVHFFDRMVPRWPTVAVNLHYDDDPERGDDVWLADGNNTEWRPAWSLPGSLAQFAMGLVDTARNWQDGTLMTIPGQRDRVAHIRLAPDEGGMNLDMPPAVMHRVAQKARRAADLMIGRFGGPPKGWANHRWIRLLNATKLLESSLAEYQQAGATPPLYASLPAAAGSYGEQKGVKLAVVSGLTGLAVDERLADVEDMPHPDCELRIRPKL